MGKTQIIPVTDMGVCGLPFSSPSIFQPAFCITSSWALLFRLRPNSLMFVGVLLLLFYEFSKYLQRLRRHRTICTLILKFFFGTACADSFFLLSVYFYIVGPTDCPLHSQLRRVWPATVSRIDWDSFRCSNRTVGYFR